MMICPKCNFAISEGMQFCWKGGTKVERICPKYNSPNSLAFIFCGKCGQPLSAPAKPIPKPSPSFDGKIPKVQHDLPKELAEKILSQWELIEGERKQVTGLFADLAGYTSMSEKLNPEGRPGRGAQDIKSTLREVSGIQRCRDASQKNTRGLRTVLFDKGVLIFFGLGKSSSLI
jgi:hypothetical protein